MSGVSVIAEAGVNHNGDLARALDMVAAAAESGADYVKFQAFDADGLVAGHAATAGYQKANTGQGDQAELLRGLELSLDEFAELASACDKAGIGFMATAFATEWLDALVAMGMDRIKVASGELTNDPALRRFAGFELPILLSTGMSTLNEVVHAVDVLRGSGAGDITVLHCTSLYPAPAAVLNLRAISTLADALKTPVGYSDHSLGDHASIAAVALGAVVIEKHFTLDRSLPGPDHKASLEPGELAGFVARIREAFEMLGDGDKKPVGDEIGTAALVRRSWHAARDLEAGTELSAADLVLKRPADGLPPATSPEGLRLARSIKADTPIHEADLEGGSCGY